MRLHAQRRRRFGHLLVAGLFLFHQMAFAASITVDRFDSIVADDGQCSLREAITAANTDTSSGAMPGECPAGAGADTIALTGDVTLTAVDNTTDGANGLPSITSEMTIEGVGGPLPRSIVRDLAAPDFRILHVGSSGSLGLQSVEVGNGSSIEGFPEGSGGGIRNLGVLTLTDSTVSGNSANVWGGGILNYSYYGTVTLTLTDSTVSGNSADDCGGGICNYSRNGTATLTLTHSTVSGNSTDGGGGGIFNNEYGTLTLTHSTVSGNSANLFLGGGGIYNFRGTATLTNSTVSGNSTDLDGGGITNYNGTVTLTHSTVSGNSANSFGGGISNFNGTVTLTGSLVANSPSGGNCTGNNPITDGGSNLADDATCGTIPDTLTGLDPVLADNGGPTLTHALLASSNAINNAGTCGLATDQRGAGRMAPCDSGAFEVIGCPLLEIKSQIIDTAQAFSTCNTALLGPDVIVEAPNGKLTVDAGYLVVIKDGFGVDAGAELAIGIDPSLLP